MDTNNFIKNYIKKRKDNFFEEKISNLQLFIFLFLLISLFN